MPPNAAPPGCATATPRPAATDTSADQSHVRPGCRTCGNHVQVPAGAWSGSAIDERGEAVEQALQPELEQVLQVEVVIASGEAFEDGEAARLHD
jgi:hypothetical protein